MAINPWSVEELEYLKSLGMKRDDIIAPGLIESYRSSRLLNNANKEFTKTVEGTSEKLHDAVRSAVETAVMNLSQSVAKIAIVVGAVLLVFIIAMFWIFTGMASDFRTDRNAGYEIAAHFHMAPQLLAETLRFTDEAAHDDPDFWSWMQQDGKYFFDLWKVNLRQRCAAPATKSAIQGCFFIQPSEEAKSR